MRTSKATHVRLDAVFELTLRMLRQWGTDKCLSQRSLALARHKCSNALDLLHEKGLAHEHRYPPAIESLPCEVGAGLLISGVRHGGAQPLVLNLTAAIVDAYEYVSEGDRHKSPTRHDLFKSQPFERGSIVSVTIPRHLAEHSLCKRLSRPAHHPHLHRHEDDYDRGS